MRSLLLLLFIGVPLAEIAVFIKVGEVIGVWATVLLVILTAIIGVALLRRQGLAALSRAQKTVNEGGLPVDSVVEGVCLLVAGAFLLTPGLITDIAGFSLLIPAVRLSIAHWIIGKLRDSGEFRVQTFEGTFTDISETAGRDEGPVIEGQLIDQSDIDGPATDSETPRPKNPDSPWRPK